MADAIVVGGGISGIACAAALASSGIAVTVRERGRALAGRMASQTLRDSGTAFDGRVTDIGASYFTAREPAFVDLVDRLISRGVVRPWTTAFHVADPSGITGVATGPMRYAAVRGLRSVVGALAEEADRLSIELSSEVDEVAAVDGGMTVDGSPVGGVALCLPQPQAEGIAGGLPVQPPVWEPVIAVTCVFDRRHWIELDGVFVNDEPVITWIADDGSRRGDDAPVLVAHVHPVLAARHLGDPAAVVPMAVAAIQRVLSIQAYPDWVDAHRWTLAKPMSGREEPFWLDDDRHLGLAGDAWSGGPRVEAAWLSGHRLGLELARRLSA